MKNNQPSHSCMNRPRLTDVNRNTLEYCNSFSQQYLLFTSHRPAMAPPWPCHWGLWSAITLWLVRTFGSGRARLLLQPGGDGWRVCRIWNRWWSPWHTFFFRDDQQLLHLLPLKKNWIWNWSGSHVRDLAISHYKPMFHWGWTWLWACRWPLGRWRSRAAGPIRWCDPCLDDHATWKLGNTNHSSI